MIIEIAGQQWRIKRVEAHDPGLYVEGVVRRGSCWPGKAVVYLSAELDGDQALRVILHELTHAYIYSTQAVRPESWTEEDVCELVAIYCFEMATLGHEVCKVLFPEVRVRSWDIAHKEVRA